jgi:hypothetical protein
MGPLTGAINLIEFILSGLQALLAALPIPL